MPVQQQSYKPGDTRRGFIALAVNRHFVELWFSQAASQFTIHMINFALMVRIFNLTGSSTAISFLILAYGAPCLLFSMIAGAYVDRISRKKILVATNIIQAFIILIYLFLKHEIWIIYLLVFIYSFVNQFFLPAEAASIPNLVKKDYLMFANSLFMFTLYGSFILGYALSGPLLYFFGDSSPFFVGFILLLLAALSVSFLHKDVIKRKKTRGLLNESLTEIWKEVKEGWEFITRNKTVSFSVVRLTLCQTLVGITIVLVPAFAEKVLNIGIKNASFAIIAPAGIGMTIGAALISKFRRIDRKKLINLGTCAAGLTIILIATSHYIGRFIKLSLLGTNYFIFNIINLLFAVSLLIVFLGMEGSAIVIPAQTLLHEKLPSKIRGRVFGLLGMLTGSVAFSPVIIAGALADIISVVWVMVFLGITVFVFGLISWKRG